MPLETPTIPLGTSRNRLIEWAAEQAGHKGGQGFIANALESFSYIDVTVFPPVAREAPLLSPQLLKYAMKGSASLDSLPQWFQGLFDPVDFVVTDPLGRRFGFTAALGEVAEIPRAFFGGDGQLEQFLIPNPVAGTYVIQLIGLGDLVDGAVASSLREQGIKMFLAEGDSEAITYEVSLAPGSPGDLNRDGKLDQEDIEILEDRLNTFTNDPNDPGDIDGDGVLSDQDLAFLEQLISLGGVRKVEIDVKPGSDENPVNLESGMLPVAVLTTSIASGDVTNLDAAEVDASSLLLSGSAAQQKGKSGNFGSLEDVDGDGDNDLLVHFPKDEIQLTEADNKVILEGMTVSGEAIMGMDFIQVVPAN